MAKAKAAPASRGTARAGARGATDIASGTIINPSAARLARQTIRLSNGRSLDLDLPYVANFLMQLLNIPSPTGLATQALHLTRETLAGLKLDTRFNAKGALVATWQGKASNRPRALTAHVDTLGAMVKEIDQFTGRLRLSRLGGLVWNSVEGEGCTIITGSGHRIRGTILPRKASVHVHGGSEVEKQERTDQTMEVRIDAKVRSGDDTRRLGIDVGDFVAFDPREQVRVGQSHPVAHCRAVAARIFVMLDRDRHRRPHCSRCGRRPHHDTSIAALVAHACARHRFSQ